MEDKILSRKELYDRVWETPMQKLAKEFGISDRALAKKCDRHKIPKPPIGHWAKIANGKASRKKALPSITDPQLENVYFQHRSKSEQESKGKLSTISEQDPRVVKAGDFEFPKKFGKYHEIVAKYRKACVKTNTNRYGFLVPRYKMESPIDMVLTYSSYERACRLMQGIIKLFKSNSWQFVVTKRSYDDKLISHILADGEKIDFKLKEKVKQVEHVLTPTELEHKEKGHHYYAQKHDYINTGQLTFSLEGVPHTGKSTNRWTDKKALPLESQLVDITKGIILAIDTTRDRRLKNEEERRLRKEQQKLIRKQEHRNKVETKKREMLVSAADSFDTAIRIRNLISQIQSLDNIDEETDEWLRWARLVANDYDPTYNIKELLEKIKSFESLPYYNW